MKTLRQFCLLYFIGFNILWVNLQAETTECSHDFWNMLKPVYQQYVPNRMLSDVWLRQYPNSKGLDIFEYSFRKIDKKKPNQSLEFWIYLHSSDPDGSLPVRQRIYKGKSQTYSIGGEAYEFFSGRKSLVKEYILENHTLILSNHEKIELIDSIFKDNNIGKNIESIYPQYREECIKIDQYPSYDKVPKTQFDSDEKGLLLPDRSTIVKYSLLYGNPGDSDVCRNNRPLRYDTYSDAYVKLDKRGSILWKKVFIPYPGKTSNAFFSVLPDNTALIRQSDSSNVSIARINLCTGDSKADKNKFTALDAEMIERYVFEKMKQGENYNGIWEDKMENGVVKNIFLMNLAFPLNGITGKVEIKQ